MIGFGWNFVSRTDGGERESVEGRAVVFRLRERVERAILGRHRVRIKDGWKLMEGREMKVEGRAVVLCGRE